MQDFFSKNRNIERINKISNARIIHRYYLVYKRYLLNHGLDDDSNSISCIDLVNFVEDWMAVDEFENIWREVQSSPDF